jgi:hypothetical protein
LIQEIEPHHEKNSTCLGYDDHDRQCACWLVTNYIGQIGTAPVHFSIQRYGFGPGMTAEGSYYYDKYLTPIPVYGLENDDKSLTLCEVHTQEEYEKALIHGFKDETYAIGCPLHLVLTDDGAVGEWRDSRNSFPISLTKVGSLDDTKGFQISGVMEIPFWGQTEKHAFIGIYQASSPEIPAIKIQVVNKNTDIFVQTLDIDPGCTFGFFMTPIYMNLERSHFRPEEVYLNCYSPSRYDQLDYYSLDKKTRKFRRSRRD